MLKEAARKYDRKFVKRKEAYRIVGISVFFSVNCRRQYKNFINLKSVSVIRRFHVRGIGKFRKSPRYFDNSTPPYAAHLSPPEREISK